MMTLSLPDASKTGGTTRTLSFAVLLLAVAGVLRGWNLQAPPERGWHEMGLRQATAARNFVRHGLSDTHGLMVLNGGPATPDEFRYYVHHPPLLPVLLAGSFAVFGDTLQVYRATLVGLTLVTLTLLMLIVRRIYGSSAAVWTGVTAAFCPQGIFYATGGEVFGAGISTFLMVGIAGRVLVRPRSRILGLAVEHAGYTAAALYDWPGFLAFGLPLLEVLLRRRGAKAARQALGTLAFGVALFAAFMFWTRHVLTAGGHLEGTAHSSTMVSTWTVMSLIEQWDLLGPQVPTALSTFVREQTRAFSLPLIAALLAGSAWMLLRPNGTNRREFRGFPLRLALFAVNGVFLLMMIRATLVHQFSTVLLVPWVATVVGVFAGWTWTLGRAARILLVAWLGWYVAVGVPHVLDLFTEAPSKELPAVGAWISEHTAPGDLVLIFERDSLPYDWHTQRNVVEFCRSQELPPRALAYAAKNPTAGLFYLLPPENRLPTGSARGVETAARAEVAAFLEAHYDAQLAGGFRIYDLKKPR